jgi:hypothetical protein
VDNQCSSVRLLKDLVLTPRPSATISDSRQIANAHLEARLVTG